MLAGLALTPAIALANATEHVPWQTGTRLESGWQVSNLVRHPEFLRYELVRGAERTTLEVVADASPAGEWTTGRHRLQPGPGKPPDEALLRSLMPLLRQWEATRDRPALVPIGTSDPLQPQTQTDAPLTRTLGSEGMVRLLAGLWLVLACACWGLWSRRRERWLLLATVPVLLGLGLWLRGWPIGIGWFHLLHEADDVLTALLQPGSHAGPLPAALRGLWPVHPALWLGLAQAVHAQVWAVAAATLLLGIWASRRLPLWAVVGVLVGLCVSPAWWRAVLSELPSAWVAVQVWGSLASWELWASPHCTRTVRLLAAAHLGLTAAGLYATRPELGAAALGIVVLTHPRLVRLLGRAVHWLLGFASRHRVESIALGAALVVVGLIGEAALAGEAEWLSVSLNPMHATTLDALLTMAATLPVVWLLAVAAGIWRTPWQSWHGLAVWLGPAALVLAVAKLYLSAAHASWYEAQRYLSMLAPFLAVLAVGALVPLVPLVAGRPALRWVSLLALCLPGLPLLAEPVLIRPGDDPPLWQPLDRDRQLEARFVHEVTALAPECALVAKTLQTEANSDRVRARRWVVARPETRQLRSGDDKSGIAPLLQSGPTTPPPRCLVELRLLDCYRVGAQLCPPPRPASEVLLERRWTSRLYLDPNVHGAFERDLHLQAWRLEPPATH